MSSLKALSSLLFCGRSASPLFTTSESTAGLRHRPISQEEILPSRNSRKKPVRAHPGGVLVAPVTGKPGVRFSPPPSTPPAATLRRNQARYQNKSQLEGESDVESTDSEASSFGEDTENDSEEAKIPKPEGEAGRPGRGGYNLENVVQWNSTEFRRLKVCNRTCNRSWLILIFFFRPIEKGAQTYFRAFG